MAVAILAGTGGNPIQLLDAAYDDGSVVPVSAQAGIDFDNNGTTDVWDQGVGPGPDWWRGGATVGVGSDWEIRCTVTSGDAPNGFSPAVNTWLSLSTNRDFRLTTVGDANEVLGGVWLIEIRPAGGSGAVASATYTIDAVTTFI